jgi:hypothetical protein
MMFTSIFKAWDGTLDLNHIISGSIINTPRLLLEARAICDKYKISEVYVSYTRSTLKSETPISSKIFPILVFLNEDERNSCYNALENIPKESLFSKDPFPNMEDLKDLLKHRKVILTRAIRCTKIYNVNDYTGATNELSDYGLEIWLFTKNNFHSQLFFYDDEYFLFENFEDAAMLDGYLAAHQPLEKFEDVHGLQQVGRGKKSHVQTLPGGSAFPGGGSSGNVVMVRKV